MYLWTISLDVRTIDVYKRQVNKLWEKYHVSVTTLLDERKAAEDKLNGFLAQLGYIPKKEVDA